MIAIHPQYLTLSKLLAGRLFRIPEYQRAYSWTSKQRADLFGDIDKTHTKGKDAGHFMAATVCLRCAKETLGTDEFQVLEVVDGQQRLTTLIILLKAIELTLDRDSAAEDRLADEIAGLLIKRMAMSCCCCRLTMTVATTSRRFCARERDLQLSRQKRWLTRSSSKRLRSA